MATGVAQKKGESIEFDKTVIWNVLKKAQDEGQKYSEKDLKNNCTGIGDFGRAFKELKAEGRIIETDEKKKTGRFSSETVLKAVEPSMRKDIEELKKPSGHASLTDEG